MINAIRVSGFWKEDATVVQRQFDNLLAKSKIFTGKTLVKQGRKTILEDIPMNAMIIENETVKPDGKLAAPFTIIIPLTNPISIK